MADPDRGLLALRPELTDEDLARLTTASGGDARVALTALEQRSWRRNQGPTDRGGWTKETRVEAVRRARFAYDKGGKEHFNLISALIKSLCNSDANVGLYWLARLIEGGADPLFIARRLCILAWEDIGLADPQATIYLAMAPKSNAIKRAYSAAAEDAETTAREPVPLHLRNAVIGLMKTQGYGQGYRYVHDDPEAKGEMSCLPSHLLGSVYIKPD
jgi:putative ATPase